LSFERGEGLPVLTIVGTFEDRSAFAFQSPRRHINHTGLFGIENDVIDNVIVPLTDANEALPGLPGVFRLIDLPRTCAKQNRPGIGQVGRQAAYIAAMWTDRDPRLAWSRGGLGKTKGTQKENDCGQGRKKSHSTNHQNDTFRASLLLRCKAHWCLVTSGRTASTDCIRASKPDVPGILLCKPFIRKHLGLSSLDAEQRLYELAALPDKNRPKGCSFRPGMCTSPSSLAWLLGGRSCSPADGPCGWTIRDRFDLRLIHYWLGALVSRTSRQDPELRDLASCSTRAALNAARIDALVVREIELRIDSTFC